jgi:4-hydroxyacetophenone monooxygenase
LESKRMRKVTTRPELLAASDQEIEAAVELADPMVLRGLLYLQTGDENIASIRVASTTGALSDVMTVAEEGDIMLLRQRAAAFLRKYRDDGAPELDLNNNPRLRKSIALTVGEAIPARDIDMSREDLAFNPWARGLEWPSTPDAKQLEEFSVLVVGAGMLGLNAAVQLKRAGFTFTVIEKNSSVGGTWLENRYPGCRVDTGSRSYTLLCGADYHHPYTFSPQAENEKYLNWIADKFEVRPRVQFDTEVSSMVWDEAARRWTVRASAPDGEQVWHPNAVITAVGLFNRPNVADFPGGDEFAGTIAHTAQWPAGLEISGKRVAVVGAGCSGYQAFPEIARQAAHTYLFQNTPSWVFEMKSYLTPLPHGVNWLERNLPYYHNFLRVRERWLLGPAILSRIFSKDPAVSGKLRSERLAFIERKLGSRPDLAAKMTPNYPPNASRPVLVDEDYSVYDVLLQGNSSLITDGIERLTARGVVDKVGNEHAVDVLVLATGFQPNEFLAPMDVVGRNGITLLDLWRKDGPRAYLGTQLPGFPNFFMLYGPNTNGAGIPAVFESTTRYALRCLAELVLRPASTVTVTEEAYRQYNAELDEADKQRIWNDSGVSNYFTSRYGRSSVQSPFSGFLMWEWYRDPSGEYALRDLGPSHNEGSLVRPYFGADLVIQ